MLLSESTIASPTSPAGRPTYDNECREALKPHLHAIIDRAVKAGWDRNSAAYTLMYLAAKYPKDASTS
jgi:hypothetical protein